MPRVTFETPMNTFRPKQSMQYRDNTARLWQCLDLLFSFVKLKNVPVVKQNMELM